MDERRLRRLEPLPAVWLAALTLATLLLVVVVAGASRLGEAGPGAPPASPDTGAAVIRAVVILFAIGEGIVLVLIAWALWPSGRRRRRIESRGKVLLLALASFLQTAAALVLVWLYVHYHGRFTGGGAGILSAFGLGRTLPSIPAGPAGPTAGGEWITAAIVVCALALAAGYGLRGVRLRRPRSPLDRLAAQLQEAVEDSLEGLEAEVDPRRAVISAYARMERALAGVGMPRARHEASLEYLDRLLTMLDAPGAVAQRLTDLFQVAKFSDHPIGEEMKQEAIGLLVLLREHLRARESERSVDQTAVPA